MTSPTLEEVIVFVREFQGVPPTTRIHGGTRLESDLGITGLDGDDLLEQAGRHFRVALGDPVQGYRPNFGLAPDEFLFHSECHSFLLESILRRMERSPALRRLVRGRHEGERVRDPTVAELHRALCRAEPSK
jgi:hypothetical protein